MRTGFDLLISADDTEEWEENFLSKIAVLLQLLKEDAMDSSRRFARCCGRDEASPLDMIVALRHQTHEFFETPDDMMLQRFRRAWDAFQASETSRLSGASEDGSVCDEGSDLEQSSNEDDSGSEETDDSDEDQKSENPPSTEFVQGSNEDLCFHALALSRHRGWADWKPEDQAQLVLKTSLDRTTAAFCIAVSD